MDLNSPSTIKALATHVTSYFPDGRRLIGCIIDFCRYSDLVFIARGLVAAGNTHEILSYDNGSETCKGNLYQQLPLRYLDQRSRRG